MFEVWKQFHLYRAIFDIFGLILLLFSVPTAINHKRSTVPRCVSTTCRFQQRQPAWNTVSATVRWRHGQHGGELSLGYKPGKGSLEWNTSRRIWSVAFHFIRFSIGSMSLCCLLDEYISITCSTLIFCNTMETPYVCVRRRRRGTALSWQSSDFGVWNYLPQPIRLHATTLLVAFVVP